MYRGSESLDDFEKAISNPEIRREVAVNNNEVVVAAAVAVTVVWLAMFEAAVLPGTAAGLQVAAQLLQALAAVVVALRQE